jgi:ankyrin repeat protein
VRFWTLWRKSAYMVSLANQKRGGLVDELFEAIRGGQRERVRSLVLASPEVLRQTHDGATPVLFAAYVGQKEALEELLALAPGLSPFEAAAVGSLPALEMALRAEPAVVGKVSDDGWTLLHLAAFFGRFDCVHAVLAHGGDPKATSANALGNRPLHAAAAGNHTEVCALLLAHGAEPDARQRGGYTALHAAAQHGNEALVDALLSAGAAPGLTDGQGKDAASYAEAGGHAALASRLRSLES